MAVSPHGEAAALGSMYSQAAVSRLNGELCSPGTVRVKSPRPGSGEAHRLHGNRLRGKVVKPRLRQLCGSGSTPVGGRRPQAAQEQAFQTLKNYVCVHPVLRLPDMSKPFILQTDASADGIGAILLQEDEQMKHPVAFGSKKLLPRERNYSTIEREALAIVWGIQKFQNYLMGTHFFLETDHHPLQYLDKAKYQNSRIMRWSLLLQPYRFTVRAIKGKENVGADFLSRYV